MDGSATRSLLAGASLAAALGSAWAQMDAHQAQMKYEQSQREWRAQEEARINEQTRLNNERIGRDIAESSKKSSPGASLTPGGDGPAAAPSYGSGGGAPPPPRSSARAAGSSASRALAADAQPAARPVAAREGSRPASRGGLGEMMGMITGGACQMLFGEGIWDFRPKAMFGIDRGVGEMELDKVEYRGNAKTVAVLPQRMFRLLMFEFESPSRIRFVGQDCVLTRVGGGSTGSTGSGGRGAGGTVAAAMTGRPRRRRRPQRRRRTSAAAC